MFISIMRGNKRLLRRCLTFFIAVSSMFGSGLVSAVWPSQSGRPGARTAQAPKTPPAVKDVSSEESLQADRRSPEQRTGVSLSRDDQRHIILPNANFNACVQGQGQDELELVIPGVRGDFEMQRITGNKVQEKLTSQAGDVRITLCKGKITTQDVQIIVNDAQPLLLGGLNARGSQVDKEIFGAAGVTKTEFLGVVNKLRPFRAAGPPKSLLEEEIKKMPVVRGARCAIGDVAITPALSLEGIGIMHIVHAVAPQNECADEEGLLRRTYGTVIRQALVLAMKEVADITHACNSSNADDSGVDLDDLQQPTIKKIALPSLGAYAGTPFERVAAIALEELTRVIRESGNRFIFEEVRFVVYSDEEFAAYEKVMRSYQPPVHTEPANNALTASPLGSVPPLTVSAVSTVPAPVSTTMMPTVQTVVAAQQPAQTAPSFQPAPTVTKPQGWIGWLKSSANQYLPKSFAFAQDEQPQVQAAQPEENRGALYWINANMSRVVGGVVGLLLLKRWMLK